MSTDLQMVQDLVKCLTGVDIHRIRGTDEEVLSLVFDDPHAALHTAVGDRAMIRAFRNMRPDCIYEINSILGVCHVSIYNAREDDYLIIGPCLTEPLSESEAKLQLRRSGLEPEVVRMLVEYAAQQPVVSHETLHLLGAHLAHHLNGVPRPVPYRRIDYRWSFDAGKDIMLVDHYGELSRMRQIELRYESIAALMEAVKAGNLSLAYQFMGRITPETDAAAGNPDPVRNAQNMCIVLNTQLRCAMEEIGVHPYRLDQFSQEITLHIERLKTALEASKYKLEIIRQYCELARENAHPNLKPFTRLAVTYIKEHLSDNLTVKDTARALTVNANYLSTQFRQDVGETFIDFVNRERVNQAAALLKHTNLQIQQIAAAVGYNNTSYFARQFVKYQNMTPRAYRNRGML